MRRRLCGATVVALALSLSAFAADKKMHLFLDIGYGFGVGGEIVGTSTEIRNGSMLKQDDLYLNYGQGIKIDGGASYRLLPSMDAQLGIQFSGGVPPVTENDKTELGAVTTTTEGKFHRSQLGFTLQGAPRFTVADLLDAYVRAGIGLFFTFSSQDWTTSSTGLGTVTTKVDESNAATLGFVAGMGAEYPLTDILALYGELGFDMMTVRLKERTTTITSDPNPTPDKDIYEKDATDRDTPPKIPGSNFNVRIGVKVGIL
jgi:opacity protein-like surface antigen